MIEEKFTPLTATGEVTLLRLVDTFYGHVAYNSLPAPDNLIDLIRNPGDDFE